MKDLKNTILEDTSPKITWNDFFKCMLVLF